MYYCEINKEGYCYHSTQDELPLSDTVILAEENMIGMIWDGEKWNKPEPEPETPEEPTDNVTWDSMAAAINEGVNEV